MEKGGGVQILGKNLQNRQMWGWVGTLRVLRQICKKITLCPCVGVNFLHDPVPPVRTEPSIFHTGAEPNRTEQVRAETEPEPYGSVWLRFGSVLHKTSTALPPSN